MPDRISSYRQVRLLLNPEGPSWESAYWHLHFLTVRNGVPSAQIVADGSVRLMDGAPTVRSVAEALIVIGRAESGLTG